MRKIMISALMLSLSFGLFAVKAASPDFLKSLVSGEFVPKKPLEIKSKLDGLSYTQLSADGKTIIQYSYKSGKEEKVLFDASKARGAKVKSIQGYSFSPTEKLMLVYTNAEKINRTSFKADYYTFDVERNKLEALSDTVGKLREPIFSPNGRNIVFVRGNDLCLKKLDYGSESRVSTSGQAGVIFNGVTDWMYDEEFKITNLISWSPDSKRIAFVSLDNAEVGTYSYDVFGKYPFESSKDLYPTSNSLMYPKTGTKLPKPSLYIFDVYYKKPQQIEITEEGEFYIPRIKWSNSLEELMVFTLNRNQDRLKMYSINSKSLIAKLLIDEKNDKYVDYENIDAVHFLNDGKFTYLSEKDGYRHLYLYNGNGILDKQLTAGEYDVTAFYGYDSIKKMFYYQAAEKSPIGRDVYSVDTKGKSSLITSGTGTNSASFNNSFTYFVNESSALNSVTQYDMCSVSGKTVRTLEANKDLAERVAEMPKKEFLTFKNADGTELNAWMIKPAKFVEIRKYPVVMYQYSAPNSQEVLDAFSIGLEQELVARDFIVLCVDGRGTGARGVNFRKSTYMHLGEKEAQDQIAAANYMASLPYVNKSKIGIWGWNYGGFTTLMAMSAAKPVFAAGVAVSPVTDWKFFDAAYTERYMRRPEENVTGYDRSSPMALAPKLNGKLLLIHGTADESTHIQNTYEYATQLVKANKQFDMQIYPNLGHGLKEGNTRYHLFTRIADFFSDKLK